MSISPQLETFLAENCTNYEVVSHPYSERAANTARSACIPDRTMAKAVVLKDGTGYVMAVMPSRNRLMLAWLNMRLDRNLKLVQETTLQDLFPDCQPGAIPAMGIAYGMKTVWDDALNTVADIYIEGGNHRELIHMHRNEFQKLMFGQPHAAISCDIEEEEAYRSC
ncbi:aminoacyl-tRNA deacylase [Kistimonas scapharcae]|uniref:Aminoacyl-tRNA deacylase n=1 Tax=Kistimonas scapharcae TaxID=1036133 RepID=A0ABP8V3K2_9GAMM